MLPARQMKPDPSGTRGYPLTLQREVLWVVSYWSYTQLQPTYIPPRPCWEVTEASLTLKQAFEGCNIQRLIIPQTHWRKHCCCDTQTHTTHTVGWWWGGSSRVYNALIENSDPLFFSPFLEMISSFRALFTPPAPLHAPSLSYNSSISWLANSDSSNEENRKIKGKERERTVNERKRGRYQRGV